MVIQQPSGSIKFTNVSQVKSRRGKRTFVVVCYQNKVQDWRKGIEKDIDEVVQVPQVFVNVGKGEVANSEALKEGFGTSNVDEVVLEILNNGELQVGDKERQQQQMRLHASVLEIIASKTVNPRSGRPYPVTIIAKLLNMLSFQYTSKPAKGQALEAIKLLTEAQIIPIVRARMRIRVSDDAQNFGSWEDQVRERMNIESEHKENEYFEIVGLIDPSDFRDIDELVRDASQGLGMVEIMALDY